MILEAAKRTKSGTGYFGLASNRNKYDKIIDQFLEVEHDLVRVDVEGKKSSYIRNVLNRRIKARELGAR